MIKTYEDWENSLDQNYVRQLSPDAWDLTGSAFEAGQQSQQAKIDELQARVPEGYVVVPNEPSDYMRCTVRDFGPDIEDYENMSKWDWEKLCAEIYKAMLEAVEK